MGTLGNPSKDEHNVVIMGQRHNEAPKSVNRDKSLQSTAATPPESKTCHSLFGRTVLNPERLRTAKGLVDKAVKMHMIFSIQGPYPVVGAALRARGWVERRILHPSQHTYRHTNASDDDDYNMEDVEKEFDSGGMYDIMSRMVRNETVYFYWTNRRDAIDNRMLHKEQITNHFAKAGSFTTKVGLCVNLRNLCWFDSADPETFFPRCYRLGAEDDKHAFIEDYRRTACTSLLQCVVERSQSKSNQNKKKQNKHCQDTPLVPSKMIDCALKVCRNFLDSLEHNDIDMSLEASQALTHEQWSELIKNYYLAVHDGVEIEDSVHFVNRCQAMLCRLREVSPQLDTDGIHNVWIIKPGAMSRGRGIVCTKRLDEILQVVESDPTLIKDSKWVVQKYLERPLLVHDTKFDVRQWFLVTDWNPLTIWLYKKCYLRFCTQPYSLDTLDSSVHLCNNSIQKHLQPSQRRHPDVPADNMWSCDQFRTFLSSQGRAAQWGAIVVPGMKKAVIHALQTAQDLVESRKNTFELYGADFILGQDMCPWLIEINASPTMAPSTTVTARLCAAVQEDTLKVVLDRRQDRTANTGEFQLIYKQAAVEVPHYVGINLNVEGSQIKYPHPAPPPKHSHPSEHWPVLPALRRWGPSKVKESWIEKTRSLEILRLQLMPMGKIDSFHLPISAQAARSLDSWRRPQVLKHRSGKVCHLTPERQQHFLPLGLINPFHESDKESHSTRVSTARVSVSHPMNSFRNLPRHQSFHQTQIKTLLGSGINKHS